MLCQSRDGVRCETGIGWQHGWILFRNDDSDHPPQLDPGEQIEQRTSTAADLRISANRQAFVMRPFGKRATNVTLRICGTSPGGTALIVSSTGKARRNEISC